MARDLLRTPGPETLSVRELCQVAESSPSSFYARFGDRAGLFRVLMDGFADEFRDIIRGLAENPKAHAGFDAFVYELVLATADFCQSEASSIRRLRAASREDPALAEAWGAFELNAIEAVYALARRLHPDLDLDHVRRVHGSLMPTLAAIYHGVAFEQDPGWDSPLDDGWSVQRARIAHDVARLVASSGIAKRIDQSTETSNSRA